MRGSNEQCKDSLYFMVMRIVYAYLHNNNRVVKPGKKKVVAPKDNHC